MSHSFKLTYFPVKALAEPLRFLLSYGGLDFEDIRIPKENWQDIKHEMPFGQVPILEVDGKVAHQSVAISRYLAKKVGLVGADDWENLEIDSMVDTITDMRSKIAAYNMEKDQEKKATMKEQLFTDSLPYYLNKFEHTVKSKGFLCLGKLTWADLYFVALLDYCNGVLNEDIIKNYPNLVELRNTVLSLDGIQSWIEKRPDSDY